ncbi:hypothetical protein DASC09_054960 [Saccharomycopsis crataegensis]|uniref:Glycine zipper 2TM domain-containing protein n=1 Tax=Saccharomycopsis crataegensis TaxID=43959 RepID=A0AAV5QTF3_9ASCO|nr:hypothetical protein DASC09_054960 [Saccharomycopsis crataegensis]
MKLEFLPIVLLGLATVSSSAPIDSRVNSQDIIKRADVTPEESKVISNGIDHVEENASEIKQRLQALEEKASAQISKDKAAAAQKGISAKKALLLGGGAGLLGSIGGSYFGGKAGGFVGGTVGGVVGGEAGASIHDKNSTSVASVH